MEKKKAIRRGGGGGGGEKEEDYITITKQHQHSKTVAWRRKEAIRRGRKKII